MGIASNIENQFGIEVIRLPLIYSSPINGEGVNNKKTPHQKNDEALKMKGFFGLIFSECTYELLNNL